MFKRISISVVLAVACIAGAGCQSVERALNGLPQVSGDAIHFSQTNPISSATVDAVNLRQSDTVATADSLTVQVSAPFVGTTSIHVTNYRRQKRVATSDGQ